MADTPIDVLVASCPNIDGATADFNTLLEPVKANKVEIEEIVDTFITSPTDAV